MHEDNYLDTLLQDLSEEKQEAIRSLSRFIRIVASPGAGKTETLTRRIAWLLLIEGVKPHEIVAFTFTEKAAESMKERVYSVVKRCGAMNVLGKLGEMFVGTIHSFAMRVLQDHFDYGHYDVLDENQEVAFVIKELGWPLRNSKRYKGKTLSGACLNFLSSLEVIHNELLDLDEIAARGEKEGKFIEDVRQYYKRLDDERLMTFGQMIPFVVHKLRENPAVLDEMGIKHLLVDEYQDINRAQEELINMIAQKASVFIVGDPRQTIYQWRGSDSHCFDRFSEKWHAQDIAITENRRSTTKIIELANDFAEKKLAEKYLEMKPCRKETGQAYLIIGETPKEEAELIAGQVEALREMGYAYSDMAVLLRSVRTSARSFLEAFRKRGIPFTVRGRVGLFERPEIQALGALFAWLSGEGRWPLPYEERASGSPPFIDDDEELLDFSLSYWQDFANDTGFNFDREIAEESLGSLRETLMDTSILGSDYKSITELYHEVLDILGFKDLDPENPKHTLAMANMGRFSNILTDFEGPKRRGGFSLYWQNFLKDLNWYLTTYATEAYEERVSEDIADVEAVQITTIHQAKGLEWPVVFVSALVKSRFPSKNTGQERFWAVPRDMFDVRRYEGSEDDEARLFYVAITRARDYLFLSRFRRQQRGSTPSPFLEEIKDHLHHWGSPVKLHRLSDPPAEEKFKTFTVGDIIRYRSCPYWFRIRNLWGFQPGLTPYLGYGKSIHYILRQIGEQAKEGADPLELVDKLTDKYFFLPYAGSGQKEKLKENVKEKMKDYLEKHQEEMGQIEEVETRIEFPLITPEGKVQATVRGKIDVIITQEGEVEIRDYKTKDYRTNGDDSLIEEVGLQVQLYAAGMKSLGRNVNKGSVAFIENKNVEDVPVSDYETKSAEEKAKEVIQAVLREKRFPPRAKEKPCSPDCDFKKICRYHSA
jgi:DNA helicase-2/ATP-dependent DNA helicase PcrA